MKNDPNQRELPPVIRVFLSSTFADMERERSCFNEVLVPRLNRICAERGVSFFSVDLRWGITEEDQVNGQVLPICLSEIDKCRPFFIGILGSRYGSVMESVPSHVAGTIPWLADKQGHSITELEMLYAVLDREVGKEVKNCAFYLRDEGLSAQWYSPTGKDPRIQALRDRIQRDETLPSTAYADLDTFAEAVMADILRWLDREFPVPEKVSQVRRAWYDRELLRNYIPVDAMHRFLDAYGGESRKPLMLHGGARGKTTLLTAWQPPQGRKLLVNCGSDDAFLYWPAIVREIIDGLGACGAVDGNSRAALPFRRLQEVRGQALFFATEAEQEAFRVEFLSWLEMLDFPEPVYVVLNDLNLLEDDRSHLLAWLPAAPCGNVRILCSTNSAEMVRNAENLGWNCKEMPGFPWQSAGEYIENYLHAYGKNLSAEQMGTLLASEITAYPGQLRFVADFLIDRGRFENLNGLIAGIAAQTEPSGVYRFAFDFFAAELAEREQAAVRAVFGLLRCTQASLNEPECFRLTQTLAGVSAMEWARIRSVFEHFGLIRGDYWNMREPALRKFVDGLIPAGEMNAIRELLGDDMFRRLHTGERTFREKAVLARAALAHYQDSGCWEKLRTALTDREVLACLVRLDWRAVRAGWAALFLHGDADISGDLLALLEQYRDAAGEDRVLALHVAGLFADLEQRTHFDRVREMLGIPEVAGTLHQELERLGPSFGNLYNGLLELKDSRQFRQLLARTEQILAMPIPFTPIERCQLLFLKADSEGHLQLLREFLDTANRYYATAVQAAGLYEIRRALSQRGDALYRLGRYAEAARVQRQVGRLALRDGDLRSYLASRNVLGMCLYREEKYSEAVAALDALAVQWNRLGNLLEESNVVMNKCNALSISGDARGALDAAAAHREQLPAGDPRLRGVRLTLLSNMGAYALELKEYAAAEEYLLQVIPEAEALGLESTLVRSRNSLIRLYEETDRFMKAAAEYEQQLELLWKRREYTALTDTLRDAVRLLHVNGYAPMARQLQAQWESRFDAVEGGREFFEQQVRSGVTDAQAVDRAREQLALAKSEGDPVNTARAYLGLSRALIAGDRDRGLEYALEAARLFRRAGQEQDCENCLNDALVLLFEDGTPGNSELYAELLGLIRASEVRRIAAIWEQVGAADPAAVPELLTELVTFRGKYAPLALRCLLDVTAQMAKHCTAEQILALADGLDEKGKEALAARLDRVMMENSHRNFTALTKDYQSPSAQEMLDYYEKCVRVLEPLGTGNAAAAAGNLALIFRRRKEPEKTLHYHRLATALYKKQGKTRDYLIELMNTATACDQLGHPERAVPLLRQGMAEAAAAGEPRMEASMAGNLASFLSRNGDPADAAEILKCFAVEEQYFRDTGSQRDLVISLVNQILYLQRTGGQWEAKLEEAGKLIRANGFREFEKALARLEWQAKQKHAPAGVPDEAQAAELVRALLAPEDAYRMQRISREEDGWHAVCVPKEESVAEAELLHLFLVNGRVQAVFLCQPKMVTGKAGEIARKYVAWWNELGEYPLRLDEDSMILRADCAIAAADADGLAERFGWYCRLWQVDKSAMSMMCLGMDQLPLYQGKKLKTLNEGR